MMLSRLELYGAILAALVLVMLGAYFYIQHESSVIAALSQQVTAEQFANAAQQAATKALQSDVASAKAASDIANASINKAQVAATKAVAGYRAPKTDAALNAQSDAMWKALSDASH